VVASVTLETDCVVVAAVAAAGATATAVTARSAIFSARTRDVGVAGVAAIDLVRRTDIPLLSIGRFGQYLDGF
jgi:hypothetical protein